MNSIKQLELHGNKQLELHGNIVGVRECNNKSPFPIITRSDKSKRRILVQRSVTTVSRANVSTSGHENDFRRTPEPGRMTPRKNFHGHIRPYIPPETAEVDGRRSTTDDIPMAPFNFKRHLLERLDVTRSPTPVPSNYPDENLSYTNLDTARTGRTGWTSTTNVTFGCETLENETPRNKPTVSRQPSRHHQRTIPNTNIYPRRELATPTPSAPMDLTENVLNYYCNQKPVDKDKRIVRWIVDCEEKSQPNILPTHLPNISVTNLEDL